MRSADIFMSLWC